MNKQVRIKKQIFLLQTEIHLENVVDGTKSRKTKQETFSHLTILRCFFLKTLDIDFMLYIPCKVSVMKKKRFKR